MWNFIKSLFNDARLIRNKRQRSLPRPKQQVPVVEGKFPFLLNDPGTPNLTKIISAPALPKVYPSFQVLGYQGQASKLQSPEGHAAQVYTSIVTALNFFQKHAATPVLNWPGTRTLIVNPRAGQDLNAYYDRQHLMFFHAPDPVRKKMIFTCESVDIVAHELGHALLDALRPDFWSIQSLEIWSFHEGWSDIIAMLTVMQFDEILQHALVEVENDLSKSNSISRLAEDMGAAICNYLASKGVKGTQNPNALRDAVNTFLYVNPEKLPSHAPNDQLAAECHSFGRVFLAAFYDVLVGIYKKELDKCNDPMLAIKKARDACSDLLIRTAPLAPATPKFYDSVAKTMIAVDRSMGSPYSDVLTWAFSRRKIVDFGIKAMSNVKLKDLKLNDYDVIEMDKQVIVKKTDVKTLKLTDHFTIQAQSVNPLYKAEVEVPMQMAMVFDKNGNLVEEMKTSERSALNAVKAALRVIEDHGLFGEKSEFSIIDGKLTRNYIE